MNSSEDVHRLTETIYRNLAEQFNPAVRQILTCAKTYHKALVAASTAARAYIESLGRLGHNCKNSCTGGTEEIGEAIFRVADVQKEIQLKFEDCTKAFFAEIILPLEQKLDSEFKNAVAEQKKYHGGHKSYWGPYSKAMDTLKKFRKKNKPKLTFDEEKEIPLVRTAEKCREKLDEFRLQGLKLALLEERKCYCFILARLCSVSSTQLYYHDRGMDLYSVELGTWKQLCSQPNILPRSADPLLRLDRQQDHMNNSFAVYVPESVGSGGSGHSHTHSPYRDHLNGRTSGDGQRSGPPSEYAMPSSPSHTLPRSVAMSMSMPPSEPPPGPPVGPQVRAVYGHVARQENQLPFNMGDIITILGEPADGWQFGYSPRSGQYGWFPLSFTEPLERQRLQTQTPMRFRQRAKSYSEINVDARSLSDFNGWAYEHSIPGTEHRPKSLHEFSLVSSPSLPQLLGHGAGGGSQYFTSTTSLSSPANGNATSMADTEPPPSPPLPPPPPQFLHNDPPPPRVPPPTLSRNPSMKSIKSVHRAETTPVGVHLPPPPQIAPPPPPHSAPAHPPAPSSSSSSISSVASQAASMASSLRPPVSQSNASSHSSRDAPVVPPRHDHAGHGRGASSNAPAPPPPAPPPPPPPPSNSMFSNVTLKKTKTNDRSAPRIK